MVKAKAMNKLPAEAVMINVLNTNPRPVRLIIAIIIPAVPVARATVSTASAPLIRANIKRFGVRRVHLRRKDSSITPKIAYNDENIIE
tara:strand:+ start:201 stop:464 length:264 start_codon:yes stop_codon:yes gene_type:complete